MQTSNNNASSNTSSNKHNPFTYFLSLERENQDLARLALQDEEDSSELIANSGDEILLEIPYSQMLGTKTLSDQKLIILEPESGDILDEIMAEQELNSLGQLVFRSQLGSYSGIKIGLYFEWMESEPQAMFARLLQSLTLTKRAGTIRKTNILFFRINNDQVTSKNDVAFIKQINLEILKETERFKFNQFIQTNFSDTSIGQCLFVSLERNEITSELVKDIHQLRFEQIHNKKERLKQVYQALKQLDQESAYLAIGIRGYQHQQIDLYDLLLQNTNNTTNDPSLSAASILDSTLRDLTLKFINLKLSSCLSAPFIDSEISLSQVMQAIRQVILERLYLQEYFEINIVEHINKLESFMKDASLMNPKNELNKGLREFIKSQLGFKCKEIDLMLRNMRNFGESRFGVTVGIDFVACLIIDEGLSKPKKQVIREFTWLLTQVNTQLEQRVKDFLEECLENAEAEIRYHRIRQRNIRVTESCPIVTPYFTTFIFKDGRSLVCLKSGEENGNSSSLISTSAFQWLRRNKIILNSGLDYLLHPSSSNQQRLSSTALDLLNH